MFSRDEPRTGTSGTLAWAVDIDNPATGERFTLTLKEVTLNAPDGSTLTVDGFLMVDQDKLNAISDDIVLELHKSGALGLVHAHYVSLGGMRKLIDWHIQRVAAGAPTGKPGTSP